ncbi:MAG TPA: hypothetical protein PLW99_02435 [Candidatus Paceibacterota bacterium]|nr:MAG: hypothetical protein B7X03_03290 [Parcubacteria group bacterium 21-58-10]HQT82982.1 hypothetical protein [Candidatus Paceibacterota bacterium]
MDGRPVIIATAVGKLAVARAQAGSFSGKNNLVDRIADTLLMYGARRDGISASLLFAADSEAVTSELEVHNLEDEFFKSTLQYGIRNSWSALKLPDDIGPDALISIERLR